MSPCARSQVDGAAAVSTAADRYGRRKKCSEGPLRDIVMSSHSLLDGPSPVAPHKHRGPESTVFPCAWHLVNSINERLWSLSTPKLYHSLVLIEL